jgi:hypothetical protein
MARNEKRYHYIYKTTCKITNKFYVGMHSTDNLDDGYMGSGKKLWNSIRKHGKENHVCEILEFLSDRSSLKNREFEIVNEQFLQDPLCMNLQLGGGGGFSSEEHRKKAQAAGGKKVRQILSARHAERLKNDSDYRERYCNSLKGKQTFLGKKHSEETKQKMRESQKDKQSGDKNSQYGTCWITNGSENKKIKKTEALPDGWTYGRR